MSPNESPLAAGTEPSPPILTRESLLATAANHIVRSLPPSAGLILFAMCDGDTLVPLVNRSKVAYARSASRLRRSDRVTPNTYSSW